MRSQSRQPENDVVRMCLDYLAVRKIFGFRVNTAGVWDPVKGIYRRSPNITKGVTDILSVIPPFGRLLAIECKTKTGKLTQDQKDFFKRVRAAGAAAVEVRKFEDLEDALRAVIRDH